MLNFLRVWILIAGYLPVVVVAQETGNKKTIYKDGKGTWTFITYTPFIIKTTFQPTGYQTNQQISNAVILKPVTKKISGIKVMPSPGNINYKFEGNTLALENYFDSTVNRGFRFRLKPAEKIFGTGERSVPLNRRGYMLDMYNQPNYGYGMNTERLNYSVPFIISSEGYGIFFDNPSKGYLDIGKSDPSILEYGASSGELSFYIISGKNIDEILRRYHSLTGTQPIPARWVFGNLMSRFGYRSETQLMDIVNKMKAERFPIDAVILDLFWFGDSIKGTMGNLDWVNKKAWPAPEKMIRHLKTQGINTVLITEPFVLNTTPNYEVSKRFHATDVNGKPYVLTDFYFGNGGLLDIFRKDAQDWFWSKYKKQIGIGVEGWWGDLGEPEKHPADVYHSLKNMGIKRLMKSDEVHNIYGHYWDKMLFDKYAKEYPAKRLFNLNRSGYAGSPRYGVFPWSGDVSRSWSGLQAQLPLMIGMSMSGIPYIHADAGGFAGGDGDPELYTRWIQFAVFTPVLRPHGTALGDLVPDVKDIPSEGALYNEPYRSIARKYIQLRYQLLPYNYTLAYVQAKNGNPLVKPLFYYDDSDTTLYHVHDQYYWGDNILVAPVLEKQTSSRKLYLPAGTWYNFFKGTKHPGRQWINEDVQLNELPVYVKAGSFIPMFMKDSIKNTSDYSGKELTIRYYPSSSSSSYTLFDDDGHTNNTLSSGNFELIHFTGKTSGNKIEISMAPGNNKVLFPRKIKVEIPTVKIKSAYINNNKVSGEVVEVLYSGKPVKILLHFNDSAN